MAKIDIFSGFLGAGKTTLIKKLIKEAYAGEKLVLIENEFGEIGIDGRFLQDAGIEITEMNSGCICCSLVGNFSEALKKVLDEYSPDRVIIEPSGVGKLSDVIKAVEDINDADITLNSFTTVADATKCKMYMKNFGEFYNNQIENANCIVLSRTQGISEEKLSAAISLLREKNEKATIITTDWDKLDGKAILEAMEHRDTIENDMETLEKEHHHHHDHVHHDHDEHCECGCHDHDHHEHHHHDHDEHCECGCHDHDHHEHHRHDHDEHCECGCHDHDHHEHHHHDHDEHCECSCHDHDHHEHHHHDHDEHCECGCHDHHHHHHADEVFVSCGGETIVKYTEEQIKEILSALSDEAKYGVVLRAKGIVDSSDGEWIHFDYVPEEIDVRRGSAGVIGRVCIIGANLNEHSVKELFKIN